MTCEIDTGYRIREGSRILAERRAEREREEQIRQAAIRAGWVRYLGRKQEKAA